MKRLNLCFLRASVSVILAGALLSTAHGQAAGNLPSEDTVNGFLHQMFGYEPDVTWKVQSVKPSEAGGLSEVNVNVASPQGTQAMKFYVTADGKHAISGELLPFGAQPFAEMQKKLEAEANGPSRGPKTAPVMLVVFSDLQCPHCKESEPALNELLEKNQNVRLVFQSFPLPNHDWAMKAARYADCIGQGSSDNFFKFVDGVFAAQTEITASNADEKLKGIAEKSGAKPDDVAACAAKSETESQVQKSIALGKSLEVNSTPTIFINGRRIPGGIPYDPLQKMVDFAAKEKK
jgi:protein-disulfide isomerase